MAIKIFSYRNTSQWTDEEMGMALELMPDSMRRRILMYKSIRDRMSRLAGRLLLRQMLQAFDSPQTLTDVVYTAQHKPYLSGGIDFSISHTDGLVLCAGTTRGRIGVDAESVREINLADYQDILSDREYRELSSPAPGRNIWDIWTIKEAVAKSSGLGIEAPLSTLDTTESHIEISSDIFRWYKLNVGANFVAHLAVNDQHINHNEIPEIEPYMTMKLLSAV